MNSVSVSNTVNIEVVQENERDIQQVKAVLLKQLAPVTQVNFENQFFQKFYENNKRLEVVKEILCRKYFEKTDEVIYQQTVVPQECMRDIIRTLHEDVTQGHPGSKRALYLFIEVLPNLAIKVQTFMNISQTSKMSKPIDKQHLKTPWYKI